MPDLQLPLEADEQSTDAPSLDVDQVDEPQNDFARVARGLEPIAHEGDEDAGAASESEQEVPRASTPPAPSKEWSLNEWAATQPAEAQAYINKLRQEEALFAQTRERLGPIGPLLDKAYNDPTTLEHLKQLTDPAFYNWTFGDAAEVYEENFRSQGGPAAGEAGAADEAYSQGAPPELVNRLQSLEAWKSEKESHEQAAQMEAAAKAYEQSRVQEFMATAKEIPALFYWNNNPEVDKRNRKLAGFIVDYAEKMSVALGRRVSYKEAYEQYADASAARPQPPPVIAPTSPSGPPKKQEPPPTDKPEETRERMKLAARKAGSFARMARAGR